MPLRDLVASFERELILAALHAAGGNQKRAAEALGVLPTTLQEKLKRLGIATPRSAKGVRGGERAPMPDRSTPPPHEALQTPQEDVKS